MRSIPSIQIWCADIIFAIVLEHAVSFTPCSFVYHIRRSKSYFTICLCLNLRDKDFASSGTIGIYQIIFSGIFIGKYGLITGICCSASIVSHINTLIPFKLSSRTVRSKYQYLFAVIICLIFIQLIIRICTFMLYKQCILTGIFHICNTKTSYPFHILIIHFFTFCNFFRNYHVALVLPVR